MSKLNLGLLGFTSSDSAKCFGGVGFRLIWHY